jgi:hypothetical protein
MGRNLKTATIAFALALFLLPMAPALMAQEYGQQGAMNQQQIANNNGYRDGFDHGRFDRTNGNRYDFHNRDYHRADRGYVRGMGNHDDYQNAYRHGYRLGYNDGFNGRRYQGEEPEGNYNSAPPYAEHGGDNDAGNSYGKDYRQNDVAFEIGFRDGRQAAEKDLSHNNRFRPTKHDKYEDASHGYRKSYGDKQSYKNHYRQGFLRGYQNAFPRQY